MEKRLLLVMLMVVMVFSLLAVPIYAADPTVGVTVIGPDPEVTVNTGPNSDVTVNGEGLATSEDLSNLRGSLAPTQYEDPWMSVGQFNRWKKPFEEDVAYQRQSLDMAIANLAKDISLDLEQDVALKAVILAINDEREFTNLRFNNIVTDGIMMSAKDRVLQDSIISAEDEIKALKETITTIQLERATENNRTRTASIISNSAIAILFAISIIVYFGRRKIFGR